MPRPPAPAALPRTGYTPREVAASLGIKYHRVLALCASGELGHMRLGQQIVITAQALDEFIAANTSTSKAS